MIARWFHVRLRAAEKALRQGRIDDAYATARQPDLHKHPRAQKLLDELVKPLLARARLHRQAGRYRAALADLDKLESVGRAGPDVQTLRARIAEQMRAGDAEDAEEREAVARAAQRLRAGRLETGRLDIQRVEDTRQRGELAQQLEHRLQRGEQLLRQATEALDRNDLLVAIRFWQDARNRYGHTRESDALAARLVDECRRTLDRWHREGRLELLLAARSALTTLGAHDPTLAEHERLVQLVERAAGQLAAADYDGLRRTLLRVKAAGGEAPWLGAALEALARISEGQELLMASPLGLFSSVAGEASPAAAAPTGADPGAARAAATLRTDPDALRLDKPLLVLVDGGGSNLLIARERIQLGRTGSSAEVDVPIPAEVQSHHADIVRRGEDYFLTAYGPARVNSRPVEHTLLHDGDRITLGDKAKMTFLRPSGMSATAVLKLSHRCRLPQDVSEVILFDQTCLIGPETSCHVRTHGVDGRVVLFERAGGLQARQTAGQDHLSAPVRPVALGETLEFGDLRVTVKQYDARGAHGGT